MDLETVKKVNAMAGRVRSFDWFMYFTARYGYLAFILYGFWLWFGPARPVEKALRRKTAVKALLAMGLCSSLSWLIGKAWARKRPFMQDRSLWNFTGHKANASFPSNHTANSAAIVLQLLRDRMPGAWVLTVWSGVVSFSRIYAGIHFPTDILGGWGLAGGVHFLLNRCRAVELGASAAACLSGRLWVLFRLLRR